MNVDVMDAGSYAIVRFMRAGDGKDETPFVMRVNADEVSLSWSDSPGLIKTVGLSYDEWRSIILEEGE